MYPSLLEFLKHILDECEYLESSSKGKKFNDLFDDETLKRAVIRSIEIIGEASKKIPPDFKLQYPHIDWKKMAGARDMMIHDYFGIDYEIVWDIIKTKVPELKSDISDIIQTIKNNTN